jgi:hypothetical protein
VKLNDRQQRDPRARNPDSTDNQGSRDPEQRVQRSRTEQSDADSDHRDAPEHANPPAIRDCMRWRC